jgi:hypothetical protein
MKIFLASSIGDFPIGLGHVFSVLPHHAELGQQQGTGDPLRRGRHKSATVRRGKLTNANNVFNDWGSCVHSAIWKVAGFRSNQQTTTRTHFHPKVPMKRVSV